MTALVFPGQGSQARGMGGQLFDLAEYGDVESEVDGLLDCSLRERCTNDPHNRLRQTQYTQPSLYVASCLHLYKAVIDGVRPTTDVAGHSVGEYNALVAAGMFDFMTDLRLAVKRGELKAQVKDGAWARSSGSITTGSRRSCATAVFAATMSPISIRQPRPSFPVRSPGLPAQASGSSRSERECTCRCRSARHFTRAIDAATPTSSPNSCVHSRSRHDPDSGYLESYRRAISVRRESINSLLVRQATRSLESTQSIRWLLAHRMTDIREIGPGNVLTGMVQQIQHEPVH
ncbi:acyltransferase domain-containing protein [Tahibacter sp.]|uniref:acyltransferase domain-containing protein n=1 Tax=Tahibacter sp. TaxID=2056211 RepID=UPI0028C3BE44|nr:acyltransferase domain-containing protein [Tahibacter sp.]